MKPCPFAGSHLADALAVDLAFDVGHGSEIGETVIDDEIPFTAHSTANESG